MEQEPVASVVSGFVINPRRAGAHAPSCRLAGPDDRRAQEGDDHKARQSGDATERCLPGRKMILVIARDRKAAQVTTHGAWYFRPRRKSTHVWYLPVGSASVQATTARGNRRSLPEKCITGAFPAH
jgi:hypothetical protein